MRQQEKIQRLIGALKEALVANGFPADPSFDPPGTVLPAWVRNARQELKTNEAIS